MKVETVVDRKSLDHRQFKAQGGGFERLNRAFDGRLGEVLEMLRDEVWRDSA